MTKMQITAKDLPRTYAIFIKKIEVLKPFRTLISQEKVFYYYFVIA